MGKALLRETTVSRNGPSPAFAEFARGMDQVMRRNLADSAIAQERLRKAFQPLTESYCSEVQHAVMRYLSSDPGSGKEARSLTELTQLLGIPLDMRLQITLVESEDPSIDGKLRGAVMVNNRIRTRTIPFLFNLRSGTYESIDGRWLELPFDGSTAGLPPALASNYFRVIAAGSHSH